MLALLVVPLGCELFEEAPVRVVATPDLNLLDQQYYQLKVTCTSDSVTIKDIVVNKGNLELVHGNIPTTTLKYGESETYATAPSESLLQVEVITETGSWTLYFD